MAIAVAPVTSWRFYDTIYTERYMRTPQENPKGYDDNSPLNYANLLKGDYLLIHGSADDNVHVQNTTRMVEALVQADKQFEWMIYPDKNHGIYGGNTRLHLYKKMTSFINKSLGDKTQKMYSNTVTTDNSSKNIPVNQLNLVKEPTIVVPATTKVVKDIVEIPDEEENAEKEIEIKNEVPKVPSKREIRRNNIRQLKEIRKQNKEKTKRSDKRESIYDKYKIN